MEGHAQTLKLNLAQLSRLRVTFHTLPLFQSFTHVNFACVLTEKLRDSGNQPWHGSQRVIDTQVRISCVEAAVWVRHLQLSCDTTRDRLDIWTWTSVDLLYLQYVYIYKSLFYFKKSFIGGGSLNCTGYKLILQERIL